MISKYYFYIMTRLFAGLIVLSTTVSVQAQTQIYLEDFDNGIPVNYTLINNDGLIPDTSVYEFSAAWIALANPDNTADTIVGSTSYFDPSGIADRWLITPQIALGTFGNFLSWDARSHDASFPDGYYVLASKTDTQISSFTDTVFFVGGELSDWNVHEVNLSDFGLDNEQVHIAFVNRTFDGFKLYVDSIGITSENPVGLQESHAVTFISSPNPTNDVLYFNQKVSAGSLYSLMGQEVLHFEDCTQIQMNQLPSGSYWLQVETSGSMVRQKIVRL